MKACPYLFDDPMVSCKADLGKYVPSLDELDAFCTTPRHIQCPFFCIFDNGAK
jgi:hypothetical protein